MKPERRTLTGSTGVIDGELGRIVVPENRSRSDSREIELTFLRLKSRAPRPGPPVVFLEGGPGLKATPRAESVVGLRVWEPILEFADVILLDPRGTRDPALRFSWTGPVPEDFFADASTAMAHRMNVSRQAADTIRERGVDLCGYTNLESADDVDAVRSALGLEEVALLGFSYGSQLALNVLRSHGHRVSQAVLCGVEGLNQTYKLPVHLDTQLRRIAALVARDPTVGADVPDLVALFERVSRALDRNPMTVEVENRRSGETLRMPVGRFGLHLLLRMDIGDSEAIPCIPRLLASIDQGRPHLLQALVQRRLGFLFGTHGAAAVPDIAAGATAERLATIRRQAAGGLFADVANFPYPQVAAAWDVPDLGDAYRSPVVSDVRTLFLSGALDWNTPPFQAEQARWGFVDGTHVVVEGSGHEQTLFAHRDVPGLIGRFLRGQDVAGCRIGFPPVRFAPIER